jgi:hypothetical protein
MQLIIADCSCCQAQVSQANPITAPPHIDFD